MNGKNNNSRYSPLEALNKIRNRVGIADLPVEYQTLERFKERVANERRVELCFEDHRFWDVRRWCIGATTQTQIDGVSIVKTTSGFDYTRTAVEKRTWADRMNLYPIPQAELFCNPNLNPQNTGW